MSSNFGIIYRNIENMLANSNNMITNQQILTERFINNNNVWQQKM